MNLNRSVQTWRQVVLLTVAGTLLCIVVAFLIDSFSFSDLTFRWGNEPHKNVVIPLLLAPPILLLLLSRMRELAIAHQQLQIIASTDGLTDCLTRRAFTTLVDAYLERFAIEETQRSGALLVIDIALREIDLVGRIGGEEFSVFLPGATPESALSVAERIRGNVAQALFAPQGEPVGITVSVGGATFGEPTNFSELYRDADQQLYKAKRTGRNRVLFTTKDGAVPLSSASLH
jgi:diguanylate cyclase